jgi:predicted Zn-dependent protease
MTAVFADFVDGRTAVIHRAEVTLDASALTIALPETAPRRWLLTDLRGVPDQGGDPGIVLTAASEPLARLYLPDTDLAATLRARAPNLGRHPPARGLGRVAAWAAGAVGSVALILFVLLPVLANQLATVLPPAGEKALGDATLEQIRQALADTEFEGIRLCEAPEGVAAMNRLRDRIVGDRALPYDLTITVLDDDLINAFALPGGHIVFFRGLIDAAQDPDEVAAVFAHELGHVVARDPVRIALRSAGSIGVLGLLLGDFAGGAAVLFLTERLIQASYTREAEGAADAFAHGTLIDARVRPDALATFFETLVEESGESSGIVRHFLSHPDLGDRIAAARAAAGGQSVAYEASLSPADWQALRAICD